MPWLLLLMLAGFYPWIRAWLAVRTASLSHALAWACAAWLMWTAAFSATTFVDSMRYLALCSTAGAGVAVLGARRPHVLAWNFVVAGLLAVLALPLLENLVLGSRPIGPVRLGFLAATLFVVLGNYLATSFAPAAILASVGCGGHFWSLLAGADTPEIVGPAANLTIALVPWVGWLCWAVRRRPAMELERRWLDFRDRFGMMWSLRLREQFNHAAEHAGWPLLLAWSSTAARDRTAVAGDSEAEMLAGFQALIRRFEASRAA